MNDVKENILTKLTELEKNNDIKILYACESGSRAWGFSSPDSDYDVRFIYMHNQDYYLSIFTREDHIELPIVDVYDVGGWDIKKALTLVSKSNSVIWEWLRSPVIYSEEKEFRAELFKTAQKYFSPRTSCFHYLGIVKTMVSENFSGEDIKIKKYFYMLRPLFAAKWIIEKNDVPPMNFFKLMEGVELEHELSGEIKRLLLLKEKSDEKDSIKRSTVVDEYVMTNFEKFNKLAGMLPVADISQMKRTYKNEDIDLFFRKMIKGYYA